ncbi:MAG: hypothetical protein ACFNS7_03190, partial [Capnocytophaga granulosa]
ENIISDFEIKKKDAEKKSDRIARTLKWTIYIIYILLLFFCIFYFGWDIMEKYTYIIGVLCPFIFPIFLRKIFNSILNKIRDNLIHNKIRKTSKYTFEEIEKLKKEVKKLNSEIIDIEK